MRWLFRQRDADPDERWLYGLAILFGVYLRVARFWESSLWLDELSTAWVASAPGWETFWQRCLLAHQPPAYFLMVKFFLLFGQTEFWLRLPTVICGLGALAAVVVLMKRVAGERAALYAGALFALNSKAIYHGQEARMYALVLLAAILSIHYFLVWIERGGGRPLAYVLTTLLTCYSHVIYSLVLFTQVAVAARLRQWRLLRWQGAAAALLVPLVPLVTSITATRQGLGSFIPRPDLEGLAGGLTWPETGLALALVVLAAPWLWRARRRLLAWSTAERALGLLALVFLAVFPAAVLLARMDIVNVLATRYLLLPILGGILLVPLVVVKAGERAVRMLLWTFVLLSAVLHAAIAVRLGPFTSLYKENWRDAIRWTEEQYRSGDVVLLRSGLIEAKYLRPDQPGVNEYLSLPFCGFYDRGSMRVWNLPWSAEELPTTPLLPPEARDQISSARQVFVIVLAKPGEWQWDWTERMLSRVPRTPEVHLIDKVEVRVYRRAGSP
jgi:hypothetical protein